jgi:hypothetical protein
VADDPLPVSLPAYEAGCWPDAAHDTGPCSREQPFSGPWPPQSAIDSGSRVDAGAYVDRPNGSGGFPWEAPAACGVVRWLAEGEGFEPSRPLRAYPLSREIADVPADAAL